MYFCMHVHIFIHTYFLFSVLVYNFGLFLFLQNVWENYVFKTSEICCTFRHTYTIYFCRCKYYLHTHVLYVLMYKLCKNFSIFIGVITILSLKIPDTKNCNFKLFECLILIHGKINLFFFYYNTFSINFDSNPAKNNSVIIKQFWITWISEHIRYQHVCKRFKHVNSQI